MPKSQVMQGRSAMPPYTAFTKLNRRRYLQRKSNTLSGILDPRI